MTNTQASADEFVTAAETRRRFHEDLLPLFEKIAHGFLNAVVSHWARGKNLACQNYLDGMAEINGKVYKRRLVVLAVEDLKQEISAPPELQSEAYAQMSLLKFEPIPKLNNYRDIATAILRMDTGFQLTKMAKARDLSRREPLFH